MKTAIYARVSTDAQAEKGYSIEAQLDKLRAYCALSDIKDYEEYVDAGYTGSDLNRPEIKRLIQDIKIDLISSVIICKLDRISRKTKDTLYLVEDVFIKHNVKFISLSENLDTSTSSGKFFLSILSSVAQLERENIKERSMSGMKKKAELGIKSRTPRILIGYDYNEKTKQFTTNDYEAVQIKLIFEKYLDGESIGKIFDFLKENYTTKYGKWKCVKNIQNILDNETYLGKFVYQKNYKEGNNIPRIIDDESFKKVKEIRQYKKQHYYRHTSGYLLTGLIFCGECGSRLRGAARWDKTQYYYVCYSRDGRLIYMKKTDKCYLPYYRMDFLNESIEDKLKQIAKSKIFFNDIKSKDLLDRHEIDTLEKEIKKLSEKSSRIVDLLIDAEIDKETCTKRLIETNKQKENIEKRLHDLKNQIKPISNINHNEIKDLVNAYSQSEITLKRQILTKLIKKIVLFKDRTVNIEWNF